MKPEAITALRYALGKRWGLDRALTFGELGMLLRLKPANARDTVLKLEDGRSEPSGPVSVLLDWMAAGGDPPTKADALKPTTASSSPRGPHGLEARRAGAGEATWAGDPRNGER